MQESLKRCTCCILPETYPSITFDEEGVCNYCRQYQAEGPELTPELQAKNSRQFDRLLEAGRGTGRYDCLVGMSGGKDSTYVAYALKEKYGLNILGYTFDNGLLPPAARENIESTANELRIDHIYFRPRFELIRQIFRHLIASGPDVFIEVICPSCTAFYGSFAKIIALRLGIPFVILGWAAEQDRPTIRIGRTRFYHDGRYVRELLDRALDTESSAYVWEMFRAHMHAWIPRPMALSIVKRIPPRFFRYTAAKYPMVLTPFKGWGYYPDRYTGEIIERGLISGGKEDVRETNCLMVHFFQYFDGKRLGHSPFVREFARYVREGLTDRETWLRIAEQAYAQVRDGTYRREQRALVLERLGLTEEDIPGPH